jgi:predicted CDP-diglyceride synthetase/phosphatidate cytidylyltransferase
MYIVLNKYFVCVNLYEKNKINSDVKFRILMVMVHQLRQFLCNVFNLQYSWIITIFLLTEEVYTNEEFV